MPTSPNQRFAPPPLSRQMDLFAGMASAYAQADALTQDQLYGMLQVRGLVDAAALKRKEAVGVAQAPVAVTKRKIRWYQQDLRQRGLIERVPGLRGTWRATEKGRKASELTPATPRVAMIAFSTDLGVALWGACNDVFDGFTEDIGVCITSPPYPLRQPRAYGNVDEQQWVDWVCTCLEPIIRKLVRGGTLAINVSNDIFLKGTPARSTYVERFVLAMCDRFGLFKMDSLVWENPCKPPGPLQWASKSRQQLNVGYEPVLVFTNDPKAWRADNRRVLQPHTETHLRLQAQGGEGRQAVYGDGAYRIREGSFSSTTLGRIPRNVLRFRHNCPDQAPARRAAKERGLPMHGALMPLALADFLVRWLAAPDDLVAEPFGGWWTVPRAAEINGRPWISSEMMLEYATCGAERFVGCPGFER
ncbi:MAG: DNA methyltransferase [Polaromonas sp.]|nr:DNA methyltransferase [Polaromonas sp.]